jgi:hypothetical protein
MIEFTLFVIDLNKLKFEGLFDGQVAATLLTLGEREDVVCVD